jgi:hypothetical protein
VKDYQAFIQRKSQCGGMTGFEPVWMPDFLFDFQRNLVDWSIRKGRAALFCDCGLGKSPMQLTWAENVCRKENGKSLIIAPLAVSAQTEREGEKFGIDCKQSRIGKPMDRITVTNYEQLHRFNPADFVAVVCDESSILKNYSGKLRTEIIAFMQRVKYRLLCSATPSPNDYTELGNSVEALGISRRVEMLANYFIHDAGDTGKWRIKGHGANPFWRFVVSWARAVKSPSDLGFDNGKFTLPPLTYEMHVLKSTPLSGYLFPIAAVTLDDQRQERRETIEERCGLVAEIANRNNEPFAAWCSLNSESEMMAKMINGAVEITGRHPDEERAEAMLAFSRGEIRAIVSKPSLCGHGMNWQHCRNTSFFPSHSHEQFYQAIRRFWRFGQTEPVTAHIVTTEAESAVLQNLMEKEKRAEEMFSAIVANMKEFYSSAKSLYEPQKAMEIPQWL